MNFLWINQVHISECEVCKNLPFATEPIYYQHHWWCPYPKESVLKTVLWSCQLAQTREHWIPIPLCCKNYTSWFLDICLDFYIDYRNMFILTYYTQYSPICWFNRNQRFKGHLLDPRGALPVSSFGAHTAARGIFPGTGSWVVAKSCTTERMVKSLWIMGCLPPSYQLLIRISQPSPWC